MPQTDILHCFVHRLIMSLSRTLPKAAQQPKECSDAMLDCEAIEYITNRLACPTSYAVMCLVISNHNCVQMHNIVWSHSRLPSTVLDLFYSISCSAALRSKLLTSTVPASPQHNTVYAFAAHSMYAARPACTIKFVFDEGGSWNTC